MKIYRLLFLVLLLGIVLNCSKSSDDSPEEPVGIDKSANLKATGDSANDILSNDNFTRMEIEVVHVAGFQPTQQAMNDFMTFLNERTFKEDIEVIYREVASPNEEDLTLTEIAQIEDENRTLYNDGETLAIYIYFADAPSVDDDLDEGLVTLGAVYRNTSMIIYESTVRQLANQSGLITNADVETATLNHEFGHLFGLVDLGTPEVNPHEDPDAGNHCDVAGCLMRAELQFGGGMMSMLESRTSKGIAATPSLDAECILDLQNNGGK
ncbi:hypothetical protein [Muriicola sp. Z0-33]|uniref:hypothetical protein n=1 Tax=Muriicola sp. Z0-33 TaxID=2816957 RepID=UPI002237BAE9|nr:hypothetical protein [Muriicola sp. Z0-33]MCW5516847.1 hypothetical protein [Muriicola sp. Z0-33]